MKKSSKKTIRGQIINGYKVTILLTAFLVLFSIICLYLINIENELVKRNRKNQMSTQEAVISHYEWLENLNYSIQSGTAFDGSLDPSSCSLGRWLSGLTDKDLRSDTLKKTVEAARKPHDEVHSMASMILELAKTDKTAAYDRYINEVKPMVQEVINDLNVISSEYVRKGNIAEKGLGGLIFISLFASLIMTAIVVFFASRYAKKTADKISKPITAVAEWSKKLSLGVDDLEFDTRGMEDDGSEISVMIEAFKLMVKSIQDNVSVIKRVADGDMTAFVNIRSGDDSLGKNLYRMVQSNDTLFSEILEVAHNVANDAGEITDASEILAKRVTAQAESVDRLSETIDYAGSLILEGTEKMHKATEMSDDISQDARLSTEKMGLLLQAVEDIYVSSEKISGVIRMVDDIASQTNLLSLNASIEAARAGEAGRGFAVVAGQVRDLALKSADAVRESQMIIEKTIEKAQEGSRISAETSQIFDKIITEIGQITSLISDVSDASNQQLQGIEQVRHEIGEINQIASGNAATSEEAAAASRNMSDTADYLREMMKKFNLRKREMGRAYIPPEKKNDHEYIQKANENYQKALEAGHFGYEYIDPTIEKVISQIEGK